MSKPIPSAFPSTVYSTGEQRWVQDGMNMQDWFAGMAMIGLIVRSTGDIDSDTIATEAYDMADAMLAWKMPS